MADGMSQALEEVVRNGQDGLQYDVPKVVNGEVVWVAYEIDVKKMEQENLETGRTRKVRRMLLLEDSAGRV